MLQGFLAGNLGRDAETRTTQGGAVCSFSVAVEQRKGKEKHTTWVRCSLWGKRGEAIAQYLTKGTRVAVAGELSLHEYNGKTSLECRVGEVTLLGGGARGAARGGGAPEDDDGTGKRTGFDGQDYGGGSDDEIPFILNVTCEPAERWWR